MQIFKVMIIFSSLKIPFWDASIADEWGLKKKKGKKSKQPCANSPFPRSYYSSRRVKKGVLTSLNPKETRF